MRWSLPLFLLVPVLCGCAKLQYLDEALALRGFAQEKDAQGRYVEGHDATFDELWRQAQAPDGLAGYKTKDQFDRNFGAPILCRGEDGLERCLYRRIARAAESPKVYVYYDANRKLVRWRTVGN